MQWNSAPHAAFTDATPWLAVNDNYKTINVAIQENDDYSVLNYFRKMVQLRKNNQTLIYGTFELVDNENDQIFAYTRQLENEKFLVVLNFSDKSAILNTTISVSNENVLISNYEKACINNSYKPYAAVIYKINH
jgi:oligo-1,6-glucosidase